jgi:hypothetical protein
LNRGSAIARSAFTTASPSIGDPRLLLMDVQTADLAAAAP